MGNAIKCRNFQKQLIFYYIYKFKNHFIRIRQKFDFVKSFFCKIHLNTYTLNNTAILNFRQLFSDLLIYSSGGVAVMLDRELLARSTLNDFPPNKITQNTPVIPPIVSIINKFKKSPLNKIMLQII